MVLSGMGQIAKTGITRPLLFLDSSTLRRIGFFELGCQPASKRYKVRDLKSEFGGASVLVNGAVFKTVSETARAGSGRFDSYTPPPRIRK
ncbi:MAG TPA: hypothetical protein DC054_02610 [Blastocatellia bacterium]|nr:hypothetical protein [Blastocatellia bacterium]